tara:strand:+ start:6618 stop:7142 length:525 start_codon:yes stop_codon:yes gene_type:complete
MTPIKTLVLNSKPMLEKDSLVELFTETHGRIRAFAKYSQSKKPRFGGQLNTLNLCDVLFRQHGERFYIGQVSVIKTYNQIKKSYDKIQIAYDFLHVIRAMTQMNFENNELFFALLEQLDALNDADRKSLTNIKLLFFKKTLEIEGVLMEHAKLNENDLIKMIESYTNMKLRNDL